MARGDRSDNFLARRLRRLIDAKGAERGRRYTHQEVAEGVAALDIAKCSEATIQGILSGRMSNPSANLVKAMASYFGVPPSHFIDGDEQEAARLEQTLQELGHLRRAVTQDNDGMHQLVVRARALSPHALADVLAYVGFVESKERDQHRQPGEPADPDAS